jgi:hypothetical protein
MKIAVIVLCLLPTLIKCSGEGNIHLLEEDVALAIRACVIPSDDPKGKSEHSQRSGLKSIYNKGHFVHFALTTKQNNQNANFGSSTLNGRCKC